MPITEFCVSKKIKLERGYFFSFSHPGIRIIDVFFYFIDFFVNILFCKYRLPALIDYSQLLGSR